MPEPCHVLVYGPPAAGKLTVATKLADLYGLRVVDNHASVDPALRLFSFGQPEFMALVEEIRVALIRAAAGAGISIVSTVVYGHGEDDEHVRKLAAATTVCGGRMYYVQLRPSDAVLEQRVLGVSRVATKKISDVGQLRDALQRHDLTSPIHPDDLIIDNSEFSPDEVALQIGEAFDLEGRDFPLLPGAATE